MMKHAIAEAGRHFTSRRMLQDYVRRYYAPAARPESASHETAGTAPHR
jgi:hypothetical protein